MSNFLLAFLIDKKSSEPRKKASCARKPRTTRNTFRFQSIKILIDDPNFIFFFGFKYDQWPHRAFKQINATEISYKLIFFLLGSPAELNEVGLFCVAGASVVRERFFRLVFAGFFFCRIIGDYKY